MVLFAALISTCTALSRSSFPLRTATADLSNKEAGSVLSAGMGGYRIYSCQDTHGIPFPGRVACHLMYCPSLWLTSSQPIPSSSDCVGELRDTDASRLTYLEALEQLAGLLLCHGDLKPGPACSHASDTRVTQQLGADCKNLRRLSPKRTLRRVCIECCQAVAATF